MAGQQDAAGVAGWIADGDVRTGTHYVHDGSDQQARREVLSGDEVERLMAGLLTSGSAPTDTTRLGDWLRDTEAALEQQ